MNSAYDNFIISAIEELPATQEEFLQLKKKLSKQYKLPIPTNADLRDRYNDLVLKNVVKPNRAFEAILLSRRIRTQSGVAVVAVLTKSYPCPGKCIYCPSEKEMPKSYLSNEPAVMRAIDSHFDPYRQVQNRLRSLELNGHKTDKIELIVMGGTFSYLPKAYKKRFITRCFQACNEYGSKKTSATSNQSSVKNSQKNKLENEQKKNELAKHRIIGLTLETRPDYINEKEVLNFRKLGCTRVELGVQSIYDDVLLLNKRGHLIASTIKATKLLKDTGFKINYHMMPGLPGSTPGRDFKMFKQLFEKQEFQPDMLKIYPTVVLKDSLLYNIWKEGKYKPLTNSGFEKLVLKIKNTAIPPYVRIARLIRDVPTSSIIAGPTVSNLRQIIIPQSNCPCIRCREVREGYTIKDLPAMLPDNKVKNISNKLSEKKDEIRSRSDIAMQAGKITLDRIDYPASDGLEIFLQYVSPDPPRARLDSTKCHLIESKRVDEQKSLRVEAGKQKLFALLRLRIPSLCHPERPKEVEGSEPKTDTDFLKCTENNKLYILFPVLKNSALIREVHTYGKMTQIDEQNANSPQHIGLGKKLLLEAERIAKEEYGLAKIVVISGVGVRNYYRKAGYKLKDTYLVKKL